MQNEVPPIIPLLSRRLHALQSLASKITQGQLAYIALDFEEARTHDREKERLCAEIRCLDQAIADQRQSFPLIEKKQAMGDREQGAEEPNAKSWKRVQELWIECNTAQAEVCRKNRVFAEFLQRARRTNQVMVNILSYSLGLYPAGLEATVLSRRARETASEGINRNAPPQQGF